MADGWLYWRAGSIKGPVSHEQLKQLAVAGNLASTDLVWPEGGDPRRAVQAQSVLNFAAVQKVVAASGKLLDKVNQALAAPPPGSGSTPDWLADVQPAPTAEETAAAILLASAPSPVAPKAPATPPAAPAVSGAPATKIIPLAKPVNTGIAPRPTQMIPYPPRLVVGGASSRGRVRERNEDRFQTLQWNWNDAEGMHDVAILVVADGMGGYQGGDEASALTVRTVSSQFTPVVLAAMSGRPTEGATIVAALDLGLREANRVVLQMAGTEAKFDGMGATAAAVVVWDGRAYFGHVGDCRVYHRHGTELKQLTEDQTLVGRMVALGQLTPEEAANHEKRNEVTQAIGKRPTLTPSQGNQELRRGDYLLVACDGLAAHVDDQTIQRVLNESTLPAQHLASLLVAMTDGAGGSDNCTVVVAQFA